MLLDLKLKTRKPNIYIYSYAVEPPNKDVLEPAIMSTIGLGRVLDIGLSWLCLDILTGHGSFSGLGFLFSSSTA